jgi:hypothetical protein
MEKHNLSEQSVHFYPTMFRLYKMRRPGESQMHVVFYFCPDVLDQIVADQIEVQILDPLTHVDLAACVVPVMEISYAPACFSQFTRSEQSKTVVPGSGCV